MKEDPKHAQIRNIAIAFAAFQATSFRNADLTDANFTKATLKNTDFKEADLTRTCFHKTKKLDRIRPESTYLQNTQLRELLVTGLGQEKTFDQQQLRGLNLRKANLEMASFIDTDLSQTNLLNANLSRTILVRTNLEKADLRVACLTGSCIQDWTISKETKLDGIVCDYVFLKWADGDKRERMPPKGEFKDGEFIRPLAKG